MSVKVYCDMCKQPIYPDEQVNVFRMWNVPTNKEFILLGLHGLPFDGQYQICNSCLNRLFNYNADQPKCNEENIDS